MLNFKRIPSGAFVMGSEVFHPSESPSHRVWVDSFEIATTSVTRAEYGRFLGATGHDEPRDWSKAEFLDPEQPVVGVNWFDAVAYCKWVSGLLSATCRLPTEAEWERACRGTSGNVLYYWGNEEPSTIEYFQGKWNGPRPVAAWQPNKFGLWNMGDNIHEWCQDWYSADYYAISVSRNPAGPLEGTRRVSRGGSWRHQVKASRVTQRSSIPPTFRYTDYGFRIVRSS